MQHQRLHSHLDQRLQGHLPLTGAYSGMLLTLDFLLAFVRASTPPKHLRKRLSYCRLCSTAPFVASVGKTQPS